MTCEKPSLFIFLFICLFYLTSPQSCTVAYSWSKTGNDGYTLTANDYLEITEKIRINLPTTETSTSTPLINDQMFPFYIFVFFVFHFRKILLQLPQQLPL